MVPREWVMQKTAQLVIALGTGTIILICLVSRKGGESPVLFI